MAKFSVYSGNLLVGHSYLEQGDAPMGVAFGVFDPVEGYAEIQYECANNHADQSALNLSVRTETGAVIPCQGVSVLDYSAEFELPSIEINVMGIPYPRYGELFPQHLEAYQRQCTPITKMSHNGLCTMASFRTRSVWRGLLFGLITNWLVLLGLLVLTYLVRPFVWPIFFGGAYSPTPGPIIPATPEWFSTQAISAIAAIACGFVAAYWSKPRSWLAPGILAAFALGLAAMRIPEVNSKVILVTWLLLCPLGVFVGAAISRFCDRRAGCGEE